jgi:hypothetical protein
MLDVPHPLESLLKTFLEEPPGLLSIAAEAIRAGNELLRLRREDCAKQVRVYGGGTPAEPDVEEVREIGVADVVVVGRISKNKRARNRPGSARPHIQLTHFAPGDLCGQVLEHVQEVFELHL